MSDTTQNGCGLWVFGAMIALIIGTLLSVGVEQSSFSSETLRVPPTATIEPEQTDTFFVVQDNQITYTYSENLGKPCYLEMGGQVFDLEGNPFTEFVVNIKMLDDLPPEETGYALPGEGGHVEDGPSRWITLLPAAPVEYEIWLSTEIGGDDLSPHIIVPPKGCAHNLAIINFVQVKSPPWSFSSETLRFPFTVTVEPEQTDSFFVVQDNQITYTYSENLGKPCYLEMGGQVFDLEGNPFTDFVVYIKMLDELAPERPGYAFPGEGAVEHGWITLLPAAPVEYEIWLSTEIGGDELSPHIIVPPKGCGLNLAIINFVQVSPLP
jgi:hypothetical protein